MNRSIYYSEKELSSYQHYYLENYENYEGRVYLKTFNDETKRFIGKFPYVIRQKRCSLTQGESMSELTFNSVLLDKVGYYNKESALKDALVTLKNVLYSPDLFGYLRTFLNVGKKLNIDGIDEPKYLSNKEDVDLMTLDGNVLPGTLAVWSEEFVENTFFYKNSYVVYMLESD